jgi:hypothetical protein
VEDLLAVGPPNTPEEKTLMRSRSRPVIEFLCRPEDKGVITEPGARKGGSADLV